MVIIRNISNKPVGIIGGTVCLPNQKVEFKDKDVMCDVFDEDDNRTGEKHLLPGLRAMERQGYIVIDVIEEKTEEKPVVEEKTEEVPVKKTRGRKKAAEE